MMTVSFEKEVESALEALHRGEIILYPTDTIWGIGCDATNSEAIRKIYRIKERPDSKSLIVLVAEERDILQHVAAPDLQVFDFIEEQPGPTTVIFDGAIGLPDNLVAADGSIAIRMVQDEFCRHLIKRLRRPIVSTSANISGEPAPTTFGDITPSIKAAVDHVVRWRQDDGTPAKPSQIVRWRNGKYEVIRPFNP